MPTFRSFDLILRRTAHVLPAIVGIFAMPLVGRAGTAGGASGAAPAIAAAPSPGRLVDFSARATIANGSDVLIAGFAIAGVGAKPVLVRGVGPTLSAFGVPGPMADPVLSLHSDAATISSNDDWGSIIGAAELASSLGAFALPLGSRDAAMRATLVGGNYSAIVSGKDATTGAAMLEIYDADTAGGGQVINFSARARIGGTAGSLTGGFVIDGSLPRRMLIRAVGPSLNAFISGSVADLQLALFKQGVSAPLMQNDNWGGTAALRAAFGDTGAFSLTDTSKDAAILATLDPGVYSVLVSPVGNASGIALVEIYDATSTTAGGPVIAAQPASLTVVPGASASLTVIAVGSAPVNYQWRKDGVDIPGATADTFLIPNAQLANTGTYTVTLTNSVGSLTSSPAAVALSTLATALPPPNTFDLVGFATKGSGTTGGGLLAPTDPNYQVLDASIPNRAQQLRTWLESTTTLVVDIQVDVDLGALGNLSNRPKTNPELVASGLGLINIRSNKTVFSSTGATLRHGSFSISGQNNIIIRNLRFRGLWEFDEGSQNPPDNAPWGYKIQDWDYIVTQNNARNVWIDHCDFEKSYDGIADVKAGADLVTFSWCRLGGDTEGAVARQIAYLEKLYQGQLTDDRITFTFYKGLRDGVYAAQGIPKQSVADIIAHELPHDKCNLIGSSDTQTTDIGFLNLTFHHIYYHACRQRLPRMRFGNAHVFNLFVDNSIITEGTNMGTATTCDAAVFAENSYYFEISDPFPPQSGTSPPGRLSQSGSKWILHGFETSLALNTFLKDPATWTWNTSTKNFTWSVATAPNARALPYSYQPDPVDYTKNNLSQVGVIVPANSTDQAILAGYLLRTAH